MACPKEHLSFYTPILFVLIQFCNFTFINCDSLSHQFVKKSSVAGTARIILDNHNGLRDKRECAAVCARGIRCNYFYYVDGVCQLMATEQLPQAGNTIYSKVGNDAEGGFWRVRNTTCTGSSPPNQKHIVSKRDDCLSLCLSDTDCICAVYSYSNNKYICYIKKEAEMIQCMGNLVIRDYRDLYFKM